MKQADLKEKSSVFVIGKGIIVIVLTGIASLSFLLGFFVGKTSRPPELNQSSAVTSGGKEEEIHPVASDQTASPQQADPLQQAEEAQAPNNTMQTDPGKTLQAVSETRGGLQTQARQKTDETQKSGANSQGHRSQGTTGSNVASEKKKSTETHADDKTKKYTVQVGAFRNASDADAVRSKLEKKGYKTFLVELKTKNKEPLYKVAVGAFSTRNEAEVLALRIQKSEGLKTFVTLK